jgi:hypothetical protein
VTTNKRIDKTILVNILNVINSIDSANDRDKNKWLIPSIITQTIKSVTNNMVSKADRGHLDIRFIMNINEL